MDLKLFYLFQTYMYSVYIAKIEKKGQDVSGPTTMLTKPLSYFSLEYNYNINCTSFVDSIFIKNEIAVRFKYV